MATGSNDRSRLARLARSLSLTWAVAWLVGLGLLAAVAIGLAGRLQRQDLDDRLALHGMAVYGLGWYDADGRFHDEVLLREPDLVESPFDTWVVLLGEPPTRTALFAKPRFEVQGLVSLAEGVARSGEDLFVDQLSPAGTRLRVHVLPTFPDDDDPVANGAVVVVGDRQAAAEAQRLFAARLLLLAGALGVLGLGVGIVLSRRSVLPLAAAFAQRERFVAAAAHELRSPLASLEAVCESARAGDESSEAAMERVSGLVGRTIRVVDELLLYARLDAGAEPLQLQPLRLDLLAETALPEGSAATIVSSGECVIAGDERLLRAALRLLLDNARQHGGASEAGITVRVSPTGVSVEDNGQGFPGAVLARAETAFELMPSSVGAGLGLAVARMIAALHGGELQLENRVEGGARATLRLSGSR